MSRVRLDWFNLDQKQGQDLCLKIPLGDIYCDRIDRAFPNIEHVGWRDSSKGTSYTFIKTISDDDRKRLNELLEVLAEILCLTTTEHLKGHFTDELDEAYALDFNFNQNKKPTHDNYTKVGDLVYRAKWCQNGDAARELAEMLARAIQRHPTLLRADIIAAVPPRPSKKFHLPNELLVTLEKSLDRQCGLGVSVKEISQLKELAFDRKIAALADAFSLKDSVNDRTILLIDDLYQSGATLWSFAKFLKSHGAREIYGLTCEKSWSDTDNV